MVNARERPLPDWARWNGLAEQPWSVRISEDAMVVEPGRGVLAALGPNPFPSPSPFLCGHAVSAFDGTVVTITTTSHQAIMAAAARRPPPARDPPPAPRRAD